MSFVLAGVDVDSSGRVGKVTIIPPRTGSVAAVAVDQRGRIVVGGGVSTPLLRTGGGFAVARYLSSR